jgi:UDP-glucuronate 4-epimerase
MKKILVTGTAGFIGFHYAKRLMSQGYRVLGVDNVNDYYDVRIKEDRLKILHENKDFEFERIDLSDWNKLEPVFKSWKPDTVVNLAAQAGVRYSIDNPRAYIDSNITGFTNVLEGSRHYGVKHLIFASSSSVYGANTTLPFSVHHNVDHPVSLYAATKKANELMAHTYAHLYRLPVTGLRFFTVYGPWGRPDMALFKFTKAIFEGQPIDVYNNGDMMRDFTYIDDIVESMVRLVERVAEPDSAWSGAKPDPSTSSAPYRLYNIGNNNPESLADFIALIEKKTNRMAVKNMLPMQLGDVYATYADTEDLARDIGFKPYTPLEKGIGLFIDWYKSYYKITDTKDNQSAA